MTTSTRRLVTDLLRVMPELAKAMHEQREQYLANLQARELPAAVRQVLQGTGKPTETQLQLGIELVQEGPATIRDLAQRLGVTPAAVSLLVDRMAEHGWVERERDTADRRVVWVRLTPGAAAVAEAMIRVQRDRLTHFLESVSEDERESFVRNARRFARVLGRDAAHKRGTNGGAATAIRQHAAHCAPVCISELGDASAADVTEPVGARVARNVALE